MKRVKGKYVAIGIVAAIGAIVIGSVVAAGFAYKKAVGRLAEEDRRLSCVIAAADAVELFVRESDPPRWPGSWDELGSTHPQETGAVLGPRDRELIEANVIIDFTLTLEEVAAQTPDEFTAIQPNGGVHSPWNPERLLDAVREALAED